MLHNKDVRLSGPSHRRLTKIVACSGSSKSCGSGCRQHNDLSTSVKEARNTVEKKTTCLLAHKISSARYSVRKKEEERMASSTQYKMNLPWSSNSQCDTGQNLSWSNSDCDNGQNQHFEPGAAFLGEDLSPLILLL